MNFFGKKLYGEGISVLYKVGNILDMEENSQIYLYLLIFRDTNKAQNL
ncbi:hypothetical protein MtrunA17_Chr3g0099201 [Medicago truncatula]|uniref:Uncharacterized protein n=1 Tax=Medicago truncatula TaxID=3880 RepID=A0A396IRX1_MEDTR|nr:hypothetical protein MtrunA17_Chr3g0099201 [Medicago truncatula]